MTAHEKQPKADSTMSTADMTERPSKQNTNVR